MAKAKATPQATRTDGFILLQLLKGIELQQVGFSEGEDRAKAEREAEEVMKEKGYPVYVIEATRIAKEEE